MGGAGTSRSPVTAVAGGTRRSRVPLVLGSLTVLVIAAMVPLRAGSPGLLAAAGTALALGVPFAGVGVVVARRQPRNPIGWLSLAFAVCFLLSIDAGFYLMAVYRFGRHLPLGSVALFVQPLWEPALATLPLMILMFPMADCLAAVRPALWVYAGLCAVFLATEYQQAAAAIAGHRIRIDSSGDLTTAVHSSGLASRAGSLGFVLLVLLALSFVGRQLMSWRRSDGERRQQLKWLVAGGAFSVISVALSAAVDSPTGIGQVVSTLLGFGLVAVTASIGVGILKYRLYDIDRIISRTLAYAILTGLLVGVYAGLVLLATHVVSITAPVAVQARRWRQRRCSTRCANGCSGRWTAGSTGPGMTRTRPWQHSQPGSKTPSTWMPSKMTWPASCTRPWNPPTYRCGPANATDAAQVVDLRTARCARRGLVPAGHRGRWPRRRPSQACHPASKRGGRPW